MAQPLTVQDFIVVLQSYFPPDFPLSHAMHILANLEATLPIMRLHHNQRLDRRQPIQTAWLKHFHDILKRAFRGTAEEDQFRPEALEEIAAENPNVDRLYSDLPQLFEYLGLRINDPNTATSLFPKAYPSLVTTRIDCSLCGEDTLRRTLRLDKERGVQTIVLLDENLCWSHAELCIANCSQCHALFYPDKTVYTHRRERRQILEEDPTYVCISKRGVWAHRRVALMQEHIMQCFAGGWSSFADWVNSVSKARGEHTHTMTARQSKRLFIEHFSRRLLSIHRPNTPFSSPAHATTDALAESVCNIVGRNGGKLPSALTHGCKDCAHQKRYRADLIAEGIILGDGHGAEVVGIPGGAELNMDEVDNIEVPQAPAQQEVPPDGERGIVRMAVMDGKTIGHRICALTNCNNPLANYRDGRFCKTHLHHGSICGIVPCGRPVIPGMVTCDNPAHRNWYEAWVSRFKRLSFPGVRRVIRRQEARDNEANLPAGPMLDIELPPLGDTPGRDVVHTFRAGSVYCLETVQWACGMPIGWGKCYRAESQPQVFSIIKKIWSDAPEDHPSFIAYDDACDLLRHIVTEDAQSPWLATTKFIVDAWHYTGHRATDALCRLWCNPAPTDGSQPDLVQVSVDDDGTQHLTRAFNTETAEQLNSWLTSYEAQLRQMTDISYDFFVHVLMLLFAERTERYIAKKHRALDDDDDDDEDE